MNRKDSGEQMKEKKISPLYKVIKWLVWLFSPKFKVMEAENLPDEPCVIVGNHSQVYGPIAGELYMPCAHETWCAAEMMEKEKVAEYAFSDFWSAKPKATLPFFRLLSRMIVPISVLIFNNADTIPVYRDTRVFTTYRLSMNALNEGRSLIIFPETYIRHNNIVCGFQKEFVDLARLYYRKTGKELLFVPMYIAPKLKQIHYGESVRYRVDCDIAEERDRICGVLMDRITDMAVRLPEHKVVPYPNVPPRDYVKNIPLEVYDEEAAI